MFKRFVPIGGFVGIFSLVAAGLVAAAAVQSQSDNFVASAAFQSGSVSNPTFTSILASRGTTEFESDTRVFEQSGTFVAVSIFSLGRPPRFEFGCFRVPDSAFSGSLAGAHLDVTVGPGVGDCGAAMKGDIGGGIAVLGGGGGPGSGLTQRLNIVLDWSPIGAVTHSTFTLESSCLDLSSALTSTSDSTRASATGTINGMPVNSGSGFKSGASLSANQQEFSIDGTPARDCGFFKG